mmetsp:Transcript_10894/g.15521  ORF Transcript_10894/g.15521 Transcript_10894/m.15521 type:complete len:87 (-) Transcript_10894:316-576(-)|eukprot:scaffold298109_cov27-Tisochrysis_lutea.AAC.1
MGSTALRVVAIAKMYVAVVIVAARPPHRRPHEIFGSSCVLSFCIESHARSFASTKKRSSSQADTADRSSGSTLTLLVCVRAISYYR